MPSIGKYILLLFLSRPLELYLLVLADGATYYLVSGPDSSTEYLSKLVGQLLSMLI